MIEVIFSKPEELYLTNLCKQYPSLRYFCRKDQLFIDAYIMKEPLTIQKINNLPNSNFGLMVGQLKNDELNIYVCTPAYNYTGSLKDKLEAEVMNMRKEMRIKGKVAILIEHKIESFF